MLSFIYISVFIYNAVIVTKNRLSAYVYSILFQAVGVYLSRQLKWGIRFEFDFDIQNGFSSAVIAYFVLNRLIPFSKC